jgi:hypothetical protein
MALLRRIGQGNEGSVFCLTCTGDGDDTITHDACSKWAGRQRCTTHCTTRRHGASTRPCILLCQVGRLRLQLCPCATPPSRSDITHATRSPRAHSVHRASAEACTVHACGGYACGWSACGGRFSWRLCPTLPYG